MMKFLKHSMLMMLALTIIAGCGNKFGEPIEITDLASYKDEVVNFEIKYPSNWMTSKAPGSRFAVFSNKEAMSRFTKYAKEGVPGARVDFSVVMLDSVKTLESVIKTKKMFDIQYKESAVTVDGVAGKKFEYSFPLVDGNFNGEFIVVSKDGIAASIIQFEAFGGSFEKYKAKFDEILASAKLATKPAPKAADTSVVTEQEPPASATLAPKSGPGYTIMIPDNFNSTKGTAKNAISSLNYIGKRRGDCNIQVDVIDASKSSNLKKIVEENKAVYKNSGANQGTKLGGLEAYMFSITYNANVKGKIYFALKDGKLYRITMNWFVPEEKDFLPVFEKSIQSIKF